MEKTLTQCRDLCTAPEFALVKASFPPAVEMLTQARVKLHVARARKLLDKYRELARGQHRALKLMKGTIGIPTDAPNARTEAKALIFEEALARFEQRLRQEELGPGEKTVQPSARPTGPELSKKALIGAPPEGRVLDRSTTKDRAQWVARTAPRVRAARGSARASGQRKQARRDRRG